MPEPLLLVRRRERLGPRTASLDVGRQAISGAPVRAAAEELHDQTRPLAHRPGRALQYLIEAAIIASIESRSRTLEPTHQLPGNRTGSLDRFACTTSRNARTLQTVHHPSITGRNGNDHTAQPAELVPKAGSSSARHFPKEYPDAGAATSDLPTSGLDRDQADDLRHGRGFPAQLVTLQPSSSTGAGSSPPASQRLRLARRHIPHQLATLGDLRRQLLDAAARSCFLSVGSGSGNSGAPAECDAALA